MRMASTAWPVRWPTGAMAWASTWTSSPFYTMTQDHMLKFGESYQEEVGDFSGDTTMAFEICVDSLDAEVARYDLRAWGQ